MLNAIRAVLLPDACPHCQGAGGVARSRLCADCEGLIPRLPRLIAAPEPLEGALVLGPYAGPIGALVRRAKYRPDPGAAVELGWRLAQGSCGRLPEVDLVTWVPVPRARLLQRGFDQSEVLGRAVAQALGRPARRTLRRVRPGEQAGRSDRARRVAARGAYALLDAPPEGARVLLVDDVITTGATAAACAEHLLVAGARSVLLLAAAGRAG